MKTGWVNIAAAVALFAVSPGTAPAQYNTATSSSGMFGARTLGGGSTAGNRSFTGSGSGSGLSNLANAGQIQGRERYLRQNRRPGQFVGTDSQEVAQNMRNFSIVGNRALRQSMAMRSMSAPPQPTAGGAPPLPFQAKLEAAFEHPQPNVQATSQRIVEHLHGARGIKSVGGPVQVVVQGETAVLRGQVASAHDRILAEQLARLEPGVWHVQNDLVVGVQKK